MTQDELDLDEALVTRFLSPRQPGESLKSAIDRIIDWEVAVNLDPSVSSAAAALISKGQGISPQPFGTVTKYGNSNVPMYAFYRWPDSPYLDNAKEAILVYAKENT